MGLMTGVKKWSGHTDGLTQRPQRTARESLWGKLWGNSGRKPLQETKKPSAAGRFFLIMVPRRGLEPPHPCEY